MIWANKEIALLANLPVFFVLFLFCFFFPFFTTLLKSTSAGSRVVQANCKSNDLVTMETYTGQL